MASPDIDALYEGLRVGDRLALARALTLVESTVPAHEEAAAALLDRCMTHVVGAPRIGITGVPGAGKSTFIDVFGMRLIGAGRRVGVCAIDPSSKRTRGSILGDKTRMVRLAADPRAFVRPTPSAGAYGGVASRTREALVILETAGYDMLLVETVGVGQSETDVSDLVDFVILLTLTGAGDMLQGMKRGVLEVADLVIVHKADGENRDEALRLRSEFRQALGLFRRVRSEEPPAVIAASSETGEGLDEVDAVVADRLGRRRVSGAWASERSRQAALWFRQRLTEGLQRHWLDRPEIRALVVELEAEVRGERRSPPAAAQQVLGLIVGG
jgi:LAO/AO transport system kinase